MSTTRGKFPACALNSAIRRAAYAAGMRTIRSYDILSYEMLETAYERNLDTPMIRLYSHRRSLILTAKDLVEAFQCLEPGNTPMARVE